MDEVDTEISVGLVANWGDAWVAITVHGWPETLYSSVLPNEDRYNNGEVVGVISLLDYAVRRLPRQFPDATITFDLVSLRGHDYITAIRNLVPTSVVKRIDAEDIK
jgi:hypothetical protein